MNDDTKYMNYLDRDSLYRTSALNCAVNRAGQDGGLKNEEVDVLAIAEVYYAWLMGDIDTEKPQKEAKVAEQSKHGEIDG